MTEYEPQSALLLTQAEWDRLAEIAAHYITCTDWVHVEPEEVSPFIHAKRDLAKRIIDANA